jgi:hypothetical protein
MKWLRLVIVVLGFGLATCTDPAVPKYPDPDDDTGSTQEKDPEKGGFLLQPTGDLVISYFV